MAEVRRYFCCTDNLTGCKILGGFQLVFCMIAFIVTIVLFCAVSREHELNKVGTAVWAIALVLLIFTGLWLLFPILLIVGAVKRNSCLLMTCIILNGLTLPFYAYATFTGTGAAIVEHLIGLGIGIWVELVAIGGYEEAKYSVNSV